MKTELCKCNNCQRLLIDENPQIGAEKVEVGSLKGYSMEWIKEEHQSYWTCSHCKTDAYLTDISGVKN